jgi:crotonobetainyl-CoA hydratase
MADGVVTVERRGKVLEITLDRPPANAMDDATNFAMYDAFKLLQDNDDLLVGLLTSRGRIFSAGWDLKVVAQANSPSETEYAVPAPGGQGGLVENWELTKPVICAVGGHAVGGGFELVLAADIVLCAEHVEFWLPEMDRGFIPVAGAVQRLPRKVPYNVAMELMYTGRRMGAAEARHWGLVSEVLAADELLPRARELADQIAQGAPLALQALKAIMPVVTQMTVREAMDAVKRTQMEEKTHPVFVNMMNSDDFLEGPRAFAEKRKPVWSGK